MIKKINVGLIGFGTIGSGVVKILKERRSFLRNKSGIEINIKKICDKDILSKRIVKVKHSLLTTNAKDILDDPSIDVIIELIGGIHPAKEIIMQALEKGKYVVTANKALLAEEGKDIFQKSKDLGKDIYFEASVAGGVPIIKSLKEGLVANKFLAIFGILNGTSNFILSLMSDKNYDFQDALREAKRLGFAERNPSLDINGIDSAHKLILLIYLAFGKLISLKNIHVEGISRISISDIKYAQELGLEVKLLAIAKKVKDELEVRIHPTLVPSSHLLSSVKGVFNAVYVSSDLAGDLLFYGQGAGRFPTASSVVSDLIDLSKNIKAGLFKSNLNVVEDVSIKRLRRIDEFESRYYVRLKAIDRPGVLAKVSGILAHYSISIASVSQKERKRAKVVPIVMITHFVKEGPLRRAIEQIDRLGIMKDKTVAIRIEEI